MPEYHQYYKGKTVLVTGGAGAIGSNLTKGLAECGVKCVIVLDNFSSVSYTHLTLPTKRIV